MQMEASDMKSSDLVVLSEKVSSRVGAASLVATYGETGFFVEYIEFEPGTAAVVLDVIRGLGFQGPFLSLLLPDGRIVRTKKAPWEPCAAE